MNLLRLINPPCHWGCKSLLTCQCGKGGSTTTVTIPPKTASELEAQDINTRLARRQEQSLILEEALQFPERALAGQITGLTLTPEITSLLQRELSSQQAARGLEQEILPRLMAQLRGESMLSPDQRAALDQLFGVQQSLGEQDIRRFAEELAQSRGLRLTDTPVAGEALRAQERLTTGLRGARAGAELDFGNRQQLFQENLRQFQEGLRAQAFQNRLALTQPRPLSLGIAQLGLTERMAQPTTKTKVSPSTFDWFRTAGSFLTGGGDVVGGLGQAKLFGLG